MKEASSWAEEIQWKKGGVIATEIVEEIQLDAFKEGIRFAANLIYNREEDDGEQDDWEWLEGRAANISLEEMEGEILLTPSEWEKEHRIRVTNSSGWRVDNKSFEDRISEDEWRERCYKSEWRHVDKKIRKKS